ncbi:hypothetical protein BU24DRAFT_491963 [Aaosphaeria arxii CBS 175.79]|uniref:Uncharacterized protein n=1 Tax=Aaosphaeria arxii CBS 175.79 TaxID=1450172 RepID=A0A6A5XRE8_9PLEO|nr:uncharacterized protein BU24DRAFT_491963 [Aaosphaeria arxii CBS 175.79]KAF2015752.1 hypothetical protein BU24DRAFT_491963 [Aaosphaeria arxii CBS 175.79]
MAANSIPLHCNICPKKPNFSDVSHLLTHISSKAHLANHYKVRLRAACEEESRQMLEAYDRWYAEWNVEELMSERMVQKDNKRRARSRLPTRFPSMQPKLEAPTPVSARSQAAVGDLLDPRLYEQPPQQLVATQNEAAVVPALTSQTGPVLRQRPYVPRMQYWAMDSRSTSQSYTTPDYETSSEYSEPSTRGRFVRAARGSVVMEDPFSAPEVSVEDPMAVSESTRLKGVYWPGMNIFDSATPEMRRKRNQKKDSSVVERLEVNSQGVEPTEMIFTPRGSFKRQRRMSCSEFDDDEEDNPVPRKSPRAPSRRPALANLDVNASRRPRQASRTQGFLPARGQHNGRNNTAYAVDGFAPRKRRTFEVFQDDEVPFGQPAGFEYLTAGFRPHQVSPSPAPTFPYKAYGGLYQNEDKENATPSFQEPIYDMHHHGHGSHISNGLPLHAFTYGLGQDQHAFQYNNHLYMNNIYQQQTEGEVDDARTLTASPSPSTG